MYPVPAPPSSSLPEEEKEHHEKSPVFKKVMDKMKRMKKAIRKKTHGHSNGGDVDDHLQDGELDEGDEEYEEDEEIKEDPAVHDVPKYESPAIGATTGAKENSVGGGEGDGLRLTTEKFVGDLDPPTTEPKTNISQVYESPATVAKTGANDISGGGGEGAERVNDAEMNTRNERSRGSPFNMSGGLEGAKGVDDFVKNPASPRTDDETDTRNEESQVYESSAPGAKTGANELLGVESANGVDDGSGLSTKDFVENPATPRTNDETNTRIEQCQVYESPATGAKTRANDISGGGGEGAERVNDGMADAEMSTRNEQSRDSPFNMSGGLEGAKRVDDFVKNPASPNTDDVMDTRNEQTQVYESSATGVKTGANELSGVESATGVDDGSGLITKDFVKNPGTPRTNDETDTRIEQSQVYESPSSVAKTGANDISGGGGEGAERLSDGMADAEMNTRNEQSRDSPFNMSGGLEGAKGVDDFVNDPALPRTDDETDTRNEESRVYENSATGAKTGANEMLGVESATGVDDGSGLITKDFVENPATARTNDETDTRIEQSQVLPVYESPATVAKTGANDISGGGGEGAERVNIGMADARDSPFNMSEGLEGAKGVNDFVKNPASPSTDDEMDTRNEQTQVYESSATGGKTGANEMLGVESAKGVDNGSGLITKDFVENPATLRTNDETDTKIEQSQVHLSPTAGGARIGVNEMSGGAEAEGDGLGIIPMDLVEDPAETNTKTEQSQGGEAVEAAPELCRSLEAMAVSPQSVKG